MKRFLLKITYFLFILVFLVGCQKPKVEETIVLPPLERPEILSKYVYLIDMDSKEILWDIKSEERIYPASITKLMSAILYIELIDDYSDTVVIDGKLIDRLEEENANMAGYKDGDEPTLLDLLYGHLLQSGADCSITLAEYISGSEKEFVKLMNAKAEELGMDHTHFVNTTGLFEPDHYSTCRDLALLFDYCMQNDFFVEVMSTLLYKPTPVKTYPNSFNCDNLVMVYINQENPKFRYSFDIPGFICGKTGFILESNFSFASCAHVNDRRLMLITIDAYREDYYPASIEDAATIYNWFEENYHRETLVHKEDTYTIDSIRNTEMETLTLHPEKEVTLSVGKGSVIVKLPESISAPIKKGDVIGEVLIYDYDVLRERVNLISDQDIDTSLKGYFHTYTQEAFTSQLALTIFIILSLLLFILILILIKRLLDNR